MEWALLVHPGSPCEGNIPAHTPGDVVSCCQEKNKEAAAGQEISQDESNAESSWGIVLWRCRRWSSRSCSDEFPNPRASTRWFGGRKGAPYFGFCWAGKRVYVHGRNQQRQALQTKEIAWRFLLPPPSDRKFAQMEFDALWIREGAGAKRHGILGKRRNWTLPSNCRRQRMKSCLSACKRAADGSTPGCGIWVFVVSLSLSKGTANLMLWSTLQMFQWVQWRWGALWFNIYGHWPVSFKIESRGNLLAGMIHTAPTWPSQEAEGTSCHCWVRLTCWDVQFIWSRTPSLTSQRSTSESSSRPALSMSPFGAARWFWHVSWTDTSTRPSQILASVTCPSLRKIFVHGWYRTIKSRFNFSLGVSFKAIIRRRLLPLRAHHLIQKFFRAHGWPIESNYFRLLLLCLIPGW